MKKRILCMVCIAASLCMTTTMTANNAKKTYKGSMHHNTMAVKKLDDAKSLLIQLSKKLASPGMVPTREINETLRLFCERLIIIIDTNIAQEETVKLQAILDKELALEDTIESLASKQIRERLDEIITDISNCINRLKKMLAPVVAATFNQKPPKPHGQNKPQSHHK